MPSTSMPTTSWPTTSDLDSEYTANEQPLVPQYGVVVQITLEYIFPDLSLEEIGSILENIILTLSKDNECKEAINPMATEKYHLNITIINATIIVCDQEAQDDLLVAVNDPELQKDIVHQMDEATSTDIVPNKTSIHGEDVVIFKPSTRTTTYSMNGTLSDDHHDHHGDAFLPWMDGHSAYFWLIVIFVQMAACGCSVSILCVIFMKIKDRKRRRKTTDAQQHGHHMDLNKLSMGSPSSRRRMDKIESFSDFSRDIDGMVVSPRDSNQSKPYKLRTFVASPRMQRHRGSSASSDAIYGQYQSGDAIECVNVMVRKSSTSTMKNYQDRTRGVSEDMYGIDGAATTKLQKRVYPTKDVEDEQLYGHGDDDADDAEDDQDGQKEILFYKHSTDEHGTHDLSDGDSSHSSETSSSQSLVIRKCSGSKSESKSLKSQRTRSQTPNSIKMQLPSKQVTKSQWM